MKDLNSFNLPHMDLPFKFKFWLYRRIFCSNKQWACRYLHTSNDEHRCIYDKIDFLNNCMSNTSSIENIMLNIDNMEQLANNLV